MANLINPICRVCINLNDNYSSEPLEISKLFSHIKSTDVLNVLQQESESLISLRVGSSASRSEVALAFPMLVPLSFSSPVQASLRATSRLALPLRAYAFLVFPH